MKKPTSKIYRMSTAIAQIMKAELPHTPREGLTAMALSAAAMIRVIEERNPAFPALEFYMTQFKEFCDTLPEDDE